MTTKWVPFVVHVRVVPARPGKRWEYIRSLQKLSVLVYDELAQLDGFQFATPGGGQAQSFSDINRRGGFGNYAQGTAIKPQIGQVPAQLMIAGFYESSAKNTQPYANHQVFSGGDIRTGPGAHTNDAVPATTILSEVSAVKTALEDAITAALPNGTEFQIFRLDYSGVTYGDKGFHFPR